MKVGIVGGSIAGCFAAILFLREGYEVFVFERSKNTLLGRGGGIGTTLDLLKQIKEEGLIDDTFAYFKVSKIPFVGKREQSGPYGKIAWEMPANFGVFQWNELWKQLRNQIPDQVYLSGMEVVAARTAEDGKIELFCKNHVTQKFDLVLFADGYNSFGRKTLFPDKKLSYRGYVLWRGLLPESKMERPAPINNKILRLSYKNEPGHKVLYFVPNEKGSKQEGDRIFNWAAYIAIPKKGLKDVMTDKNGLLREGTLPPGLIHETTEKRLKSLLSKNISSYFSKIINKTQNSYIQVIYTLDLNSYYKDNMCLIGDAGIVVQPFTGSGVFKGYHNVTELIACLKKSNSIAEALKQWNKEQLQSGKKLLMLGEQMEKAFIWEQLDFARASEEATVQWWENSVHFPDNFRH